VSRLRSLHLLLALGALLVGVVPLLPAEAATATLNVNPASGLPGASLAVSATGLPAYSLASLTWDGSLVGQPQVSSAGTFSTSVKIPTSAAAGSHTLQMRDGGYVISLSITVLGQTTTTTTTTSTAPAPTPTPSPSTSTSSSQTPQDRVLQLVNGARAQAGLAPLANNAALTSAAQSYSALMASTGCFGHTCGPVPDFSQRVTQAGYTGWTTLGENVAAGAATADEVFNTWMNSPGHRANILNASYRDSGVGMATGGPYGIYWTQEFGAR
jgi:uncharacterized protein YkwD